MFAIDHVIAGPGVVAGVVAWIGGWGRTDPFADVDFPAAIAAGQSLLDTVCERQAMECTDGHGRIAIAAIAVTRGAGAAIAGACCMGGVCRAGIAGGFQVVGVDDAAVSIIAVGEVPIAEMPQASAEQCEQGSGGDRCQVSIHKQLPNHWPGDRWANGGAGRCRPGGRGRRHITRIRCFGSSGA